MKRLKNIQSNISMSGYVDSAISEIQNVEGLLLGMLDNLDDDMHKFDENKDHIGDTTYTAQTLRDVVFEELTKLRELYNVLNDIEIHEKVYDTYVKDCKEMNI